MNVMEFLKNPAVAWFLIGLVFILLELMLPGLIVIFFGIGAWIVALLSLIFNWGVGLQILTFSVASAITLLLFRKWAKQRFFDRKGFNTDADDELTGKIVVAETSFNPGETGKVEFNGVSWTAESSIAVNKGDKLEIIDKKSITLIVKPIKNKHYGNIIDYYNRWISGFSFNPNYVDR